MHKIEQQMITALRARTNLSLGNTVVSWDDDGTATVLLHGNVIARYSKGCLAWSLAGWDTSTTRSRIQALVLGLEQDTSVCRVRGRPYARSVIDPAYKYPITSSQWVRCSPLAVVRAVLANTVSGSPVRTAK